MQLFGLALDIIGLMVLAITHGIGPVVTIANRPPRNDEGTDGDYWFQVNDHNPDYPSPGRMGRFWSRNRRRIGFGGYCLVIAGFIVQFVHVLLA